MGPGSGADFRLERTAEDELHPMWHLTGMLADETQVMPDHLGRQLFVALPSHGVRERLPRLLTASRQDEVDAFLVAHLHSEDAAIADDQGLGGVPYRHHCASSRTGLLDAAPGYAVVRSPVEGRLPPVS